MNAIASQTGAVWHKRWVVIENGSLEYFTEEVKEGRKGIAKSKEPLPVGTQVDLKFTVVMDEVETIEGVGEVVRVQKDPPGMGVVFTQLSQYSQHLLSQLLTTAPRPPSEGDE